MRKLVEEYNCGVICESVTPEGVVKGLKELLNKDLEKLGKNARRMAEDHSWEAQEEKLINLYDRVLMKKGFMKVLTVIGARPQFIKKLRLFLMLSGLGI